MFCLYCVIDEDMPLYRRQGAARLLADFVDGCGVSGSCVAVCFWRIPLGRTVVLLT